MESTASVANAPITKIMYKICCRNPQITDVYVGQTANIVSRRNQHKTTCNNECDSHHNYYVYQFIRANGGWDAWDLVPIETYVCTNKTDVATRERYWLESLGATLNRRVPGRNYAEYYIANKDEIKQKTTKYQAANQDVVKQYKAEYRASNKDWFKQYQVEYRAANKDVLKQKMADYYAANKDAINQLRREKNAALKKAK